MVEKRPEFTGPLVNSCPARLLTLEIARSSLISWDPTKCRNHHFCSIISFAFTRPLFLEPRKGGSKNKSVDRPVSKKRPPGPLINSSLWRHQTIRENIVFSVFLRSRFLTHFRSFLFLVSFFFPEIYPPNFCPLYRVAKKQGKTRVFVVLFF